jgi:hypothetical protein
VEEHLWWCSRVDVVRSRTWFSQSGNKTCLCGVLNVFERTRTQEIMQYLQLSTASPKQGIPKAALLIALSFSLGRGGQARPRHDGKVQDTGPGYPMYRSHDDFGNLSQIPLDWNRRGCCLRCSSSPACSLWKSVHVIPFAFRKTTIM